MKLQIQSLRKTASQIANWIRRYAAILAIVSVALLYSWLVLQINILNRREPSDADLQARLSELKHLQIDKNVATKLQQLEDNSVEVKTLFDQARQNPFQE